MEHNSAKADFIQMLKLVADKRMEKTMESMLSSDYEYRKMTKAVVALEQRYAALELEQDKRTVVDNLLAERDGMNLEKSSLAYWAGMMDAITILREMEVISF